MRTSRSENREPSFPLKGTPSTVSSAQGRGSLHRSFTDLCLFQTSTKLPPIDSGERSLERKEEKHQEPNDKRCRHQNQVRQG